MKKILLKKFLIFASGLPSANAVKDIIEVREAVSAEATIQNPPTVIPTGIPPIKAIPPQAIALEIPARILSPVFDSP